jgi:hypothetical protein
MAVIGRTTLAATSRDGAFSRAVGVGFLSSGASSTVSEFPLLLSGTAGPILHPKGIVPQLIEGFQHRVRNVSITAANPEERVLSDALIKKFEHLLRARHVMKPS